MPAKRIDPNMPTCPVPRPFGGADAADLDRAAPAPRGCNDFLVINQHPYLVGWEGSL